jgi:hypothetical protein
MYRDVGEELQVEERNPIKGQQPLIIGPLEHKSSIAH